jgi:hypothetical protein
MAEPPHPEQWPVILNPGEWNFIGTLTAPPSSGQIRLDNAAQTSATKMWVHKLTATGSDASTALAGIEKGMEVTIANKSDAAKTQTYAVVADPINNSGYVELPVLWQRGGGSAIPAQRTVLTVTVVSTSVSAPVTGNQMAALTSPPTVAVSMSCIVPVHGTPMQAHASPVDIAGQLITFDYAYPFDGKNYTSPGLTKREWYAGMALQGFIAKGIAHNLIGKVSEYAFKVADSMLAEEARRAPPPVVPVVATIQNPQPSTAPITHDAQGRALSRAVWPDKRKLSGF